MLWPVAAQVQPAACLQPAKADVACPIPIASGAVKVRASGVGLVARRSIIVGEVGHQSTARYRRSGESGANVVGPRRHRTSRNVRKGLRVAIRRSKTDQGGAGAVVAACRGSIACPVAAVRDWLAAAGKRRSHNVCIR